MRCHRLAERNPPPGLTVWESGTKGEPVPKFAYERKAQELEDLKEQIEKPLKPLTDREYAYLADTYKKTGEEMPALDSHESRTVVFSFAKGVYAAEKKAKEKVGETLPPPAPPAEEPVGAPAHHPALQLGEDGQLPDLTEKQRLAIVGVCRKARIDHRQFDLSRLDHRKKALDLVYQMSDNQKKARVPSRSQGRGRS